MSFNFFSVKACSETQSNTLIAECVHRLIEESLNDFFIPVTFSAFIEKRDAPPYRTSQPLLWKDGAETVTDGLTLGRSRSPDVRGELFHFFDHVLAEDDLFEVDCQGAVRLYDGVPGQRGWYDYEKRADGYESILRLNVRRDDTDLLWSGITSFIEFSSDSTVWMPRGRVYDSPPPDEYRDYNAGVAVMNVIELARRLAQANEQYQDFAKESYLNSGRRREWGPENIDIVAAILHSLNNRLVPS